MSSNRPLRSGGQILVDALRIHGVDRAFCVAGESYLEVLDALYDHRDSIAVITCRHEAGAANMAEAYGKLTGRPGLVMVTRGPGACHGAVGIHTAYQDSTPLIMLVGQVARAHMDREAFQEIDYRRMFGSVAKWVAQIDQAERIPEYISRAFHVATSGRPGPVVLALPEDMLTDRVDVPDTAPYRPNQGHPGPGEMARLAELLAKAERPLLTLGGGGWTPEACAEISRFAALWNLPVTTSFRRQDLFDNELPNWVGDLSTSVNPKLLQRVREADLLLVVGARLGDITTQGYTLAEPPLTAQALIHVHADPNELGRVWQPDLAIASGMPGFAAAAVALTPPRGASPGASPWAGWVQAGHADYLATLTPQPYDGPLNLGEAMAALRERMRPTDIVTIDAGNFSGWAQRFIQYRRPRTQVGPTNGAMGYSVPAAVAAAMVRPEDRVFGFVGDGGFMMAANELATAMQYGAKPIILVFNNGILGTIRMHQEREHPGRVMATELRNPDLTAFARSFGAHAETVRRTDEFGPALDRAIASGTAAVIELVTDPEVITTRTTLTAVRNAALARQAPQTER